MNDTTDERLKSLPDGHDLVGSRSSRRTSDRAEENRDVTQSREYDDEALLDRFRLQRHTSALPDLPVPEGYRVIWQRASPGAQRSQVNYPMAGH
mgnify:CR=1 FL=1